jgi:aminoglycoside phosphotransferase (APT) family kinase protein
MTSDIDQARPVREGEALDGARLRDYMAAHIPELAPTLAIVQFPHGHSNLTYLVKSADREWVLRRPPFGNRVKTAHDMGREFRLLSRLCHVYPPAPAPVVYCEDESILGAPFYLMERRRGVILRGVPSADRPISPGLARRLCETLVDSMATLHALDYRAAGLDDMGKPSGYVERQVSGWIKRYHDARTDDVPDLERTMAWLAANRPSDTGLATLIHNDFKFDNLVLDPVDLTRIVAVLDWEMATLGDPFMDLGTTLAYWTEPDDPEPLQHHIVGPTTQPGSMSRVELVERYAQTSGRNVSSMLFCYVCGLFKVAVIAQQIYARYVRGATKDPRFARLNQLVASLALGAVRAIETQKVGASR